MKKEKNLTIENGNDVSKSIENGKAKPFLGIDYATEKKAIQYAREVKSYVDDLYQHGYQVGFIVMN